MKFKLLLSLVILAITSPVSMADDNCKNQDGNNCQSSTSAAPLHTSGGWFGWFGNWGRSRGETSFSRTSHSSESSEGGHSESSHSGFGGEAAAHGASGHGGGE